MAKILFDKFGGDRGGFTEIEKVKLRQAVKDACEFSGFAVASAGSGFANKRDLLRMWFGADGPKTIKAAASGLNQMNDLLTDDGRTIFFVDGRHQSDKYYGFRDEPAPGLAGKYGAKVLRPLGPKVTPMGGAVDMWVRPLEEGNRNLGHVGSGLRVYIAENAFDVRKSLQHLSHIIYHELTHKILATTDEARGKRVYGVEDCKDLARKDPELALQLADSWAYFASSFKYNY